MSDALHQPQHAHQPESPVQSADRAAGILEFLGRREEAGVTDMAAALGVHKSTATRCSGPIRPSQSSRAGSPGRRKATHRTPSLIPRPSGRS
ncbi:helix-turn-helix domain-containing protein [Streptomyces sp. TRM70350]|uniref:helix-turn-helix domain-containing protein n=1 Tax=Streptomyces sp. TRM70350 TaxID=2856165 RepID=UPI00210F58DE|nr:helix-turn-helix domain-containing protein [Streptomyces sp. TRM70350]